MLCKIFAEILAQRIKVRTEDILGGIKVDLGKVASLLIIYLQIDKYYKNHMNILSVYTSYILTSNNHLTALAGFIQQK
jgi:hypothetical protein